MDELILSSIIGETIKSCYVHPVTYNMVFDELDIKSIKYWLGCFYDQYKDEHGEEYKKDDDLVDNLTWDTLAFDSHITKLEIFSENNGNSDNRGGGCGNLNIPVEEFRYTINNDKGITLRDVTEAVYRMKGSKYDYYYELYGAIEIVNKTRDSVLIKVEFGYGS